MIFPKPILLILLASFALLAGRDAAQGSGGLFPDAPSDLVMDKAGLLLPDKAAELNAHLAAGAREHGIWVYVLTVPSVEGKAEEQRQRLSEIAHRYIDLWGKDRPAIGILYDDENGEAVVAASPEMDRQIPTWARNLALHKPLTRLTMGRGLTREKMDDAARLTLSVLTGMKNREQREARSRRTVVIAMTIFFVLGGGLIAYGNYRRRAGAPPPAETPPE